MVIAALLVGLVLGAPRRLCRGAPRSRRAQTPSCRRSSTLERDARGRRGRLRRRASIDRRAPASAVKALSAEALDANSARFLELAETHLHGPRHAARRSRSSAWTSSSRESSVTRAGGIRRPDRERRQLAPTRSGSAPRPGTSRTRSRTPHVRGRWGEIQLRRVVEMAGMVEHCDFDEQRRRPTDGRRTSPAGPRSSASRAGSRSSSTAKVPLVAYLDAVREDATDDARRATPQGSRTAGARAHPQARAEGVLADSSPATPEFVVMFLPDETFLRAALEHDPSLIELAVAQQRDPRVSRPRSSCSCARSHYGWQQETVAESAREVSRSRPRALQAPRRRWVRTSRSSDATLDGAVERLQRDRRVARAPGARPGAPLRDSTASRASSPRSSQPIERRHGRSQPPELVDAGPARDRAGGRRPTLRDAGTSDDLSMRSRPVEPRSRGANVRREWTL